MTFEIAQVDSFSHQLAGAPKPVRNAMKRVIPELRETPDTPNAKIKKLTGYKRLWRFRVNDSFRLVYRVDKDHKPPTVTLILLGNRKDVYNRLGASADGTPGIRVIASGIEDILEEEPTPAEIGDAILAMAIQGDDEPDPDADLPELLTKQLLDGWSIPERYHAVLSQARTESQLLAADVPADILERVLNGLWPTPIERTLQEPVRVVPDENSLIAAAEPEQDLIHLLLKLDPEQQSFLSRFERSNPEGPWLLKGGPGSGKSVIAVYCIQALIQQEEAKLPGQLKKLKILLTTYTNSLVNAAQQLSRELNDGNSGHVLEVKTVDSVAGRFANQRGLKLVSESDEPVRDMAFSALRATKNDLGAFPFEPRDIPYLLDEVEWVIAGQDLRTVDDYTNKADRSGRKRALGRRQREQVWAFYERFRNQLSDRNMALWVDRQRDALDNAKPTYDYVFIDEAQDLKPVAIRFLQRLAKNPENLFLAADSNQSIYGTGMSWAQIAEDVKFSGRAQILKRNYRTTKEVWQAVSQLASDAAVDQETLAVEPVYSGPIPWLVSYHGESWPGRLNRFLFEALRQERLGPDSAAVLVPWNRIADEVVAKLDLALRPRAFKSRDVDIRYPGVKVLTMHSAKGLEFPVVAIAAANDGVIPRRPSPGSDPEDHMGREQRLLFVAATRAMRQLMIMTRTDSPSPFLDGITDEYWEIERI